MEDELSGLSGGVLAEAARVGLAPGSIRYYESCCRAVERYCRTREIERLTEPVVAEFAAAMEGRQGRGEIANPFRSTLTKTAVMMLEFQQSGAVAWRRRKPASGLSPAADAVLRAYAQSEGDALDAGSVRLAVCEVRQFLRYLERAGRCIGSVTTDDVRGFLVAVKPRHTSGMGNTVWAVKRLFAFLNRQGITAVRVGALLARTGPRRVRALPCFTREESDRVLAAIDTGSPRGKRDYAMVRLALSTGLRCIDIVSLRLDQIDWRRDEIRLLQHKTLAPLTLPLSAEAGNAIVDWLLHGRPACEAPEVFVRLYAPFGRLTGPTGALLMQRWLARAGVPHEAGDGKTFHGLRRTTGTRLVESGAELALTAQVLGHARVDSARRYIALSVESLRACCLPLDAFPVTREGLR